MAHPEKIYSWRKRWLKSPNGKRWLQGYRKKYAAQNKEALQANAKRDRDKLRLDVLTAYSNGTLACACCGEPRLQFLTIDHIAGNGGQERKAGGHRGGVAQYRALRRAGFPGGYRVLCWNCNCAIAIYGVCPHEAEMVEAVNR